MGRFVAVRKAKIQTQNMGLIVVQASQIASMELSDKNKDGTDKPYYENRFINRFVYMPSGFAMEKNAIEYHNYMFYYSEFAAAVNDRVSIGVGFVTVLPAQGYSLKLKAAMIRKEKFNFSLTGNLIGGKTLGNTTVLIPSFSFGKKESFFNVSPILFMENKTGSYGMSVGYMKKTSSTLTFFTENFFAMGNGFSIDNGAILSAGLRFDRSRHAFDLNVIVPTIAGANIGLYLLPTVGYHLKLSK